MLKSLTTEKANLLREFFAEADYSQESILRQPLLRDLAVRRNVVEAPFFGTEETSRSKLLMAWFYLGDSVESPAASDLIPADVLACLIDTGMLVRKGKRLMPVVMLTPQQDFLFASDNSLRWQCKPDDVVIWPNPTSQLLDRFTIRRPFHAALDLGAGCGIQAILSTKHCAHVTATDLNPRAMEFTRFNAWLNDARNIDCFAGDTFEPVRDRAFDLIVANPPFFVTPSSDRLYCENSMRLDHYCRRTIQEASAHLNEEGWAQMTLEWVQVSGQTWQERLHEWVRGSGCDVLILHTYAREAAAYARDRIEQGPEGAAGLDSLPQWLAYYQQYGVEQIHGGMLAMRRRNGNNWVRIEEMPAKPGEPFGDEIWDAFACKSFTASQPSDECVLAAQPRLASHIQLAQRSRPSGRRWAIDEISLRLMSGLPASIGIDPAVADFLARLDGHLTVAEAISAFSGEMPVDRCIVQRDCLTAVRHLIERRFLRV
jgi:methylase of polypeptide subunit release factors